MPWRSWVKAALATALVATALCRFAHCQGDACTPWQCPGVNVGDFLTHPGPTSVPVAIGHDYSLTSYENPGQFPALPTGPATTSSTLADTSRRLEELEARLSALEKQRSAAGSQAVPRDVSAEKFTIRPIAVAHADYVNYPGQNAASLATYGDLEDYFEFRRLYLGVEGTGYGVWDYRLVLNFEPEQVIRDRSGARLAETDVVQLRDLYISHRDVPLLGTVFLGNVKVPYSMEELISARFTPFMERAAPCSAFAPKRRVGILATNTSPTDAVGLSTGVFFANISQETKERVNDKQGVDWAIRSWWSPVFEADGRILLHLGASYVFTSDDDGRVRLCVLPETHEGILALDTGTFLAERLHRGGLEAAVVAGPLSVQGELYGLWTVGGPTGTDKQFYGAYVFASYFLTGEHRHYERKRGVFNRLTPLTNFWWVKTREGTSFGWGAWELAARWSWTDLDEPTLVSPLAGQMHNITFGVNWYWNPQMRMMFEWIHSFTSVRAQPELCQTDILGLSWRADF